MPVRVLIERARHVCQAIKPCFMMSPLAVSQYLPADLRFDVVIFDEASQVSPADAISCIYRGGALILAGDQSSCRRQLLRRGAPTTGTSGRGGAATPPTSNRSSTSRRGSGAYRSLTLRWHYRSRHEALIAFSNAAFYAGPPGHLPQQAQRRARRRRGAVLGRRDLPAGDLAGQPGGGRAGGRARDPPLRHPARPQPGRGDLQRGTGRPPSRPPSAGPARTVPTWTGSSPTTGCAGSSSRASKPSRATSGTSLIFSIGYGPDENGQDHDGLRPAQPAGRVAQAQRRGHPRPLPQRDRQQHPCR